MVAETYPRENSKIAAGDCYEHVGGPVVRALMTLSRFGISTTLVGAVGTDALGREVIAALERWPIDVTNVMAAPDRSTRQAHVWLSASTGSRTIVYDGRDESDSIDGDRDGRILDGISWLHLDGREFQQARALADAARERGIDVSLDLGAFKPGLPELVERCTLVIGPRPTWEEIAESGGWRDGDALIGAIADRTTCVVTEGPRRALAVRADERVTVEPEEVLAVDSNGAGDVFAGAFVWGELEGLGLSRTLAVAAAAAAWKCKGRGNAAIPGRGDLDALLELAAAWQGGVGRL